jgi:DNA adenine methylase
MAAAGRDPACLPGAPRPDSRRGGGCSPLPVVLLPHTADAVDELPEITALAPWFGSNRALAEEVGRRLEGCGWVGIPFAGGMCEVLRIAARTIAVNDRHRAVINLARTIADPVLGPRLYRRLRRLVLHADELEVSQERCRGREVTEGGLFAVPRPDSRGAEPLIEWALDYFVCSWMGRSGNAGTDGEYSGGVCVRWDDGGGDQAVRYRSAVRSLLLWRRFLERCTFTTDDAMDFIARVPDQEGNGVYCDPPFPEAGVSYKHKFVRFREMARLLSRYERTRVVCRYYDHPLVRELYREKDGWRWEALEGGKKSTNEAAPEVLLTRNARGVR